jgi:hypothetical protein
MRSDVKLDWRIMVSFMRWIAVIVWLCLLFTPRAYAEVSSPEEAQRVVANWLRYTISTTGSWQGKTDAKVSKCEAIYYKGELVGYNISISPSGFAIVPLLKELPPITAYSGDGEFPIGEDEGFPGLMKTILYNRVRIFREFYGSAKVSQPPDGTALFGRQDRNLWDQYLLDAGRFDKFLGSGRMPSPDSVGPLLQSDWHQAEPYNEMCPDGDGGTTLVGCVATAAAQIMYYWHWPPYGEGNHCYEWDGDSSCGEQVGGEELCADFSDAYDWDNMLDVYSENSPQASIDAVAELCYEIGVAFEMDYGVCGSGTETYYALDVYPIYFRYDSSIQREDRTDYTRDEWFALIQDEINAGRPIHYRIDSHSIVCDGWKTEGTAKYYHMNYGWIYPLYDVWYAIDSLYCDQYTPHICPPEEDYMITHIRWDRECDCRPGDADGDSTINIADAVYLTDYIFKGGPAPTPYALCSGDADCSGNVDIGDGVYIVNYIFKGGPEPCVCDEWMVGWGDLQK